MKRWQSKAWLGFVRSLPCECRDPRCPNCDSTSMNAPVIAAHLRNMTGVGRKPDDFLCYPLSSTIHDIFHAKGQPSVAWQLERVRWALLAGFNQGVLSVDADAAFFTTIPF